MNRFKLHDDVAVVEHDDAGRKPREGGKVIHGSVTEVVGIYAKVTTEDDRKWTFYLDSGWRPWKGNHRRLVPICHRTECEEPVLDPCADPGDPLGRQWCSQDCMMDDAEAAHEMRMRGAY